MARKTTASIRKAALCAAFLLCGGLTGHPALASVDITPVRIDLGAARDKEMIRFGNVGQETKSYQVDVVRWQQSDGSDAYEPTEDIIAVPPIFTLEPGEQQVVRLGLLREADAGRELTYRIFFTELAPPQPGAAQNTAVSMRLRIGVPIFVAPRGAALPALAVDGVDRDGDQLVMHLSNAGNVHVKVTEVRYRATEIDAATSAPTVFYLLPGQSGRLPVDLPPGANGGTVTLVTDTAGDLAYVLERSP